MPPVVIYTKSTCPFCHAAKALLHNKAAPFEEIGVDGDRAAQFFLMDERAHLTLGVRPGSTSGAASQVRSQLLSLVFRDRVFQKSR